MTLRFRTNNLITIDNVNGTINVQGLQTLPEIPVDMAILGYVDFISGSYEQRSTNVKDINSSVGVNAFGLVGGVYKLISDNSVNDLNFSFTSYGNTIKGQGNKLLAQADGINKNTFGSISTESGAYFSDLSNYNGKISSIIANSSKIKHNRSGLGAVLIQAISVALFKSLGRNAAINNDSTIRNKDINLANKIANEWNEDYSGYSNSKYFMRYLDSGRFYDDGGSVGNASIYNFSNATFDFIVKLTGKIDDSDSSINMGAISINRIFGEYPNETKVMSDGNYELNIFFRLTQTNYL